VVDSELKLLHNSINEMNYVEVCVSPALLDSYHANDKLVVVIDVFRASTAICTAIGYGIQSIIPVATVDEALTWQDKGYITAAERNGEVVAGFEFGNSPFAFQKPELIGKKIVLTTSNCTKAINKAEKAGVNNIIISSFVNLSATVDRIIELNTNVLLLCAGWKNHVSLEDTLCAGAIVNRLLDRGLKTRCDAAIMASRNYLQAESDIAGYLVGSSHQLRLGHLGLDEDLEYCLQIDQWTKVPQMVGNELVAGSVHSLIASA